MSAYKKQLANRIRQTGPDAYSEKYLRRQYFKAGRMGSIEVFEQVYKKTLEEYLDPVHCKFLWELL